MPAIQTLETLELRSPVTILIGENGCGKSTLLEAIACSQNCPAVGGADVMRDPLLEPARKLAGFLRVVKTTAPRLKLFFRAEDAIGFTRRLNEDMAELTTMEDDFNRDLSGYGRQLATGVVKGQRRQLESRYGANPDARSHGEWFLNILQTRIHGRGLFLLDEPETPLSPTHQLALLSIIKAAVAEGSQFIIASHSPIVMALPGATLYSLDHTPITELTFDEVPHISILRSFLNDPERFLRHL